MDAKYAEAVKAAKSGNVKAYRKAVGAYGEVYSHHGDHFGDKASMDYREKQTKVLEGLAAKMGVDYWGHKEAPKVSDKKFSTAAKEWGVSSEAMKYWYEEGMGKSPKKPSSSVMKEVKRLDKMVDKTFGMPLVKHLDSQASETTNVYAYALKKSQKEILTLRDKIEGKASNKTAPKSSEKTTKEKTTKGITDAELTSFIKEHYIRKRDGNYYYRGKGWTGKTAYTKDGVVKEAKKQMAAKAKEAAYEQRLKTDANFAASEAIKGAKRELRGYTPMSAQKVAKEYGKDSAEYKGWMRLSATPVPKDKAKAAVRMATLQGFGRAGDDTVRDLLVLHGYPHSKAYTKGSDEVTKLAKKYGIEW